MPISWAASISPGATSAKCASVTNPPVEATARATAAAVADRALFMECLDESLAAVVYGAGAGERHLVAVG